jgi:O-succinylbenzoic acid--CoA ligase
LLCLPASYIAGKMMLVRALILGLEIDTIPPKTLLDIDQSKNYDFSAMVPMQLKENGVRLNNIKTLIVGGAAVSSALIKEIQDLKIAVYETYGMTETVSHIAVKKLNSFNTEKQENVLFKVLPNVSINLDERECLVIKAPKVSEGKVVTNDIVKQYSKTTFEWLGRYDNIINSGGIKYAPEQLEAKLNDKIKTRFFIASENHKILGEAIIIVLEADNNQLNTSVFNCLTAFETPKAIYSINAFVETASGKIQRKKTLALLKK